MRKISDKERLEREINKVKKLQVKLNQLIADVEYMSMMTDIDLTLGTQEVEENE